MTAWQHRTFRRALLVACLALVAFNFLTATWYVLPLVVACLVVVIVMRRSGEGRLW